MSNGALWIVVSALATVIAVAVVLFFVFMFNVTFRG